MATLTATGLILAVGLLIYLVCLALSRYGRIPLGLDGEEVDHVLVKPIDAGHLAETVRRVLDAR